IRRGEDERLRLVALARPELAQPLDRSAESELGAAESFDEVAATARSERLERLQLAVHRAVAAGDSLRADGIARHDAVAFEEKLGERATVGDAVEQRLCERPAALR